MMKFESFVNEVASRIEELTTGYTFSVQVCSKLNLKRSGISVEKEGYNVPLMLYLDDSYEAYAKGNLDINDYVAGLITQLPEIFDNAPCVENYNNILDYNWVKKHLYVGLSSAKKNWALLDELPHTIIEDLMLTAHIFFGEGNNDDYYTITVKKNMLHIWHIDEKTLFEDAMKSSPVINPVNMYSPFGTPMTCVTCDKMVVGAAAGIFYPGIFEQVAEEIDGSYYIMPSSVFEVLIIPDDGIISPKVLSEMVVSANEQELKDSEVLSDHAYYYDATEKKFRTA